MSLSVIGGRFGFGASGFRRMVKAVAVAVAVASAASLAHAGVTMTADAKGGVGQLVSIQARYDALDPSTTSYLAGALTAKLGDGPAFDAYCVDLYHVIYVGGGGTTFQVNPQPIADLAAPGGNGAGIGFLYQNFAPAVMTAIDAAAIQVAIWKVEYDDGGSLTTGHFTMLDSTNLTSNQHLVFVKATADLAAYTGTQTGQATWLEATSHPYDGRYDLYQNLVGPSTLTPNAVVPTPEPASIATSILGTATFAGFALRRRLRRKMA